MSGLPPEGAVAAESLEVMPLGLYAVWTLVFTLDGEGKVEAHSSIWSTCVTSGAKGRMSK